MARTKSRKASKGDKGVVYIGIDNGVSASIGIIRVNRTEFLVPKDFTKKEQDYVKKKANVTRIDITKLRPLLEQHSLVRAHCMMERPMVNPTRFTATKSALRALEATMVVLESLKIPIQFIDSKEWQIPLLPKGIKGAPQLKKASMDIGCRMFPEHAEAIRKHKDADGLLIAEYCRRANKF